MALINNLQSLVWSQIQSILMLSLPNTKTVVTNCYNDYMSGKNLNEFSLNIQICLEIYISNLEILKS